MAYRNRLRTEHAGAKNGGGGRGYRADVKRQSRRLRRERGKKACRDVETVTAKMVAVFTTSDLQDRGRLERAMGEGYKVLVATTRDTLLEGDEWWVALVGEENIFLADPDPHERDPETGEWCRRHIGAGWRALYAHLGEEWPICPVRQAPKWWTGARWELLNRGYRLGQSFK